MTARSVISWPKSEARDAEDRPIFHRGEYSSIVGVPILSENDKPFATVLPRKSAGAAVTFADAIVAALNAYIKRPMGNSWPRPIPVTERMPAQPDADILDQYLCFVDAPEQTGWMSLEWNGKDFLLDAAEPVTEHVTHFVALPPDPPKVKR